MTQQDVVRHLLQTSNKEGLALTLEKGLLLMFREHSHQVNIWGTKGNFWDPRIVSWKVLFLNCASNLLFLTTLHFHFTYLLRHGPPSS